MAVTIHDLARMTGLNASTVSRALRNDRRVKPATRERIQELARRKGYVPNLPARQLAAGKTGNIWFCFGSPDADIERETAVELDNRFDRAGYDLQIVLHSNQPERFRRRLEKLSQQAADAAVIIPPGDTSACERYDAILKALPVPHLFVDRYWENGVTPVVTTDNALAARTLVDRCARWGARRFYLDFPEHNPVSRTRTRAAQTRIEELGLLWRNAAELAPSLPAEQPIAILGNSGKAIGADRVPREAEIYGGFFDYWENPTLEFYRSVVICRQNFAEIARLAAEITLSMLRNPGFKPPLFTRVEPAEFIELCDR